jgi:DNA-binding response OmpR family regulator
MKQQKKILFIEDEQELLTTISNLLHDQGYHVINAVNAEDALQETRHTVPDLILVDIKLPGMDGFDFFHEIRKSEQFKNVPIVFLTAFNDMNAMIYAKKSGAADYITKPFDFEYLIARIKDLAPPE